MVRRIFLPALILFVFMLPSDAWAARCTGSANCRACSSCSSCGHCAKQGGTCGVCSGQRSAPVRPSVRSYTPLPATPAPQPVTSYAPIPPVAEPEPMRPAAPKPEGAAAYEDGVALYFSPHGHCTEAIVEQIGQAKESVRVMAYRLTSVPIAQALVAAHERGVQLVIVLDGAQQSDKYSDATFFHNHQIPVFIDDAHAIAHNKVMLIDERTIITGSFNFSAAAEEDNAENLLIIRDKPQLFQAYAANFSGHLAHVSVYEWKGEAADNVNRQPTP